MAVCVIIETENKEFMSSNISCNHHNVENIDDPAYFAFRMWMIAFIGATVCLSVIVLGIVWHYERFGGDPQKRTILNQLIGMLAMNNMVLQNFALLVLLTRLAFGPLPFKVTVIMFVGPSVLGSLVLMALLNEIISLRCLTLFLWRKLPPINDDFFSMFIGFLNYGLCFMFVNLGNLGGYPNGKLVRLLSANHFQKDPLFTTAKYVKCNGFEFVFMRCFFVV